MESANNTTTTQQQIEFEINDRLKKRLLDASAFALLKSPTTKKQVKFDDENNNELIANHIDVYTTKNRDNSILVQIKQNPNQNNQINPEEFKVDFTQVIKSINGKTNKPLTIKAVFEQYPDQYIEESIDANGKKTVQIEGQNMVYNIEYKSAGTGKQATKVEVTIDQNNQLQIDYKNLKQEDIKNLQEIMKNTFLNDAQGNEIQFSELHQINQSRSTKPQPSKHINELTSIRSHVQMRKRPASFTETESLRKMRRSSSSSESFQSIRSS